MTLAVWGALLLTSYPQPVLTTDITQKANASKQTDAFDKTTEFLRAAQILFPAAQPKKIADLPTISRIGPSISCLCMLTRMSGDEEASAEFFLSKVDTWQRSAFRFRSVSLCSRDLLPRDERHATFKIKEGALAAAKKLCHVPKDG